MTTPNVLSYHVVYVSVIHSSENGMQDLIVFYLSMRSFLANFAEKDGFYTCQAENIQLNIVLTQIAGPFWARFFGYRCGGDCGW